MPTEIQKSPAALAGACATTTRTRISAPATGFAITGLWTCFARRSGLRTSTPANAPLRKA